MSGIDRVAEHLRDEVYDDRSLLNGLMIEQFSEDYIYHLAISSLTSVQYPTHSHQAVYHRERTNEDFELLMRQYINLHRERAERELRQMDADNAADARGDEMRDAT